MTDGSHVSAAALPSREQRWVRAAATVLAASAALFHLVTAYAGTLPTMQQVYVHLGFALVLIFLLYPTVTPDGRFSALRWTVDAPLILLSVASSAYVYLNFLDIARRGAGDPAPVAVARAAGLFTSRVNGDELVYNQDDVYLPDLIVCRPELSEQILAFIAAHGTD